MRKFVRIPREISINPQRENIIVFTNQQIDKIKIRTFSHPYVQCQAKLNRKGCRDYQN